MDLYGSGQHEIQRELLVSPQTKLLFIYPAILYQCYAHGKQKSAYHSGKEYLASKSFIKCIQLILNILADKGEHLGPQSSITLHEYKL